jgi:hypothetical protein
MKKSIFFGILMLLTGQVCAQIQRPMASPAAKIEQRVGLTDVKVEYFRPSKNKRVVFGNVVPFGELWRTGANDNTRFTVSDAIVFGKDTLKAGTYAIFTTPNPENWEVIFYTDYSGGGTPERIDEAKVAYRTQVKTTKLNDEVETFTIAVDATTTKSAILQFSWENTRVSMPFEVPTAQKMLANVEKAMAGPSAGDYYAAAEFYFKEKKDLKKAVEWISKACDMRPDAFWYFRLKAQIQAELGDFKNAIASAKMSKDGAEKAGNKAYVDMNNASMEEWKKK